MRKSIAQFICSNDQGAGILLILMIMSAMMITFYLLLGYETNARQEVQFVQLKNMGADLETDLKNELKNPLSIKQSFSVLQHDRDLHDRCVASAQPGPPTPPAFPDDTVGPVPEFELVSMFDVSFPDIVPATPYTVLAPPLWLIAGQNLTDDTTVSPPHHKSAGYQINGNRCELFSNDPRCLIMIYLTVVRSPATDNPTKDCIYTFSYQMVFANKDQTFQFHNAFVSASREYRYMVPKLVTFVKYRVNRVLNADTTPDPTKDAYTAVELPLP